MNVLLSYQYSSGQTPGIDFNVVAIVTSPNVGVLIIGATRYRFFDLKNDGGLFEQRGNVLVATDV